MNPGCSAVCRVLIESPELARPLEVALAEGASQGALRKLLAANGYPVSEWAMRQWCTGLAPCDEVGTPCYEVLDDDREVEAFVESALALSGRHASADAMAYVIGGMPLEAEEIEVAMSAVAPRTSTAPAGVLRRVVRLEQRTIDKDAELKQAVRELTKIRKENDELQELMARYATIKPEDMKVPEWVRPDDSTVAKRGTPVLMLSDLHLDEVVDLYEMDSMNEYNRGIATERFERIIDSTVTLMKTYVSGIHLDGIVVPILGDIVTGDIHEELLRTNEVPVPDTIVHWVPKLASGLRYLADEFGRVHVPCVAGNHDRTTKKTPSKQRMTSSYAWIIYNWLADSLRDDERITFGISSSAEQIIPVYDTNFLLTHGDAFRSAGGVGGLYPSMLKFLLRRHAMYGAVNKHFDYALMGHWHSLLWGGDFVVNGSPKGYDEYAKTNGFGFERPQQALFVVTPERGIVQRMPVHAD